MKKIAAGEFKNRCLALMDEVQRSGQSVIITKRGEPVAKLAPVKKAGDDIFDSMAGRIRIIGDIVGPKTPLEDWQCK